MGPFTYRAVDKLKQEDAHDETGEDLDAGEEGTNLILTGPNLNVLSNSAAPGFKSASVNGFEVAVARIAHKRT